MRARSTAVFALGILAAMVSGTDARAFELKHAPSGDLVRWRSANVSWTIDRSVHEVLGGEAAIQTAVDAWTRRGGAPSLAIGDHDATIAPGFDRVNGVFFMPEGFEPAGDALGHALGLSDEPAQKTALMYPYVARASALPTSPATDDINGLETLYVSGALASSSCASSACPIISRAVVWGGTIDGVRQVIAGHQVPAVGQRVGVVFDKAPHEP